MVVAVTLAQTTVLEDTISRLLMCKRDAKRTCFPTLVRPRVSRRLCTGFVIQLILGSRRIYSRTTMSNNTLSATDATYGLVAGVDEDDLVILVHTILVNPVRVQDSQVAATPANTLLRNAPQPTLGLEVVDTLADGLTVGGT